LTIFDRLRFFSLLFSSLLQVTNVTQSLFPSYVDRRNRSLLVVFTTRFFLPQLYLSLFSLSLLEPTKEISIRHRNFNLLLIPHHHDLHSRAFQHFIPPPCESHLRLRHRSALSSPSLHPIETDTTPSQPTSTFAMFSLSPGSVEKRVYVLDSHLACP